MNNLERQQSIKKSWDIHNVVETAYLKLNATKGDEQWLAKQRVLLADMALHLLQTALNPGEIDLDKLKNNLHAILTISDEFLPKAGLVSATENLYQ
ncbi:MAG: hypothetical protein HRT53_19000 [Colwellia sp.]|nr:hypothetical protein [Colwellia sp.]